MKKITLLIALLVCSVGFGQISVGSAGDVSQKVTVQKLSDVDPSTYVNANQQRTYNQNVESATHDPNFVPVQQRIPNQNQGVYPRLITSANDRSNVSTGVNQSSAFYGANSLVGTNPLYTSSVNNGVPGTATVLSGGDRSQMVVITHSNTQTINAGDEIACASTTSYRDNSIFRDFDLAGDFGIAGDFDVTDAEIAIGIGVISPGGFPLTVNIYSMATGTFPGSWPGSATLQGTATITITVADSETIVSLPVTATIPAGESLIYEVMIVDDGTDTNYMRFGANLDGQTGPSYIMAVDCGAATPMDLFVAFGLQNSFVMNIIGDQAGGGGACPAPVLEVNQNVTDVCMANISQTDLAQSYIAVEAVSAGAGVEFQALTTGLDVNLSLWDNLPNAGGTMLASGISQTDGVNLFTDVFWDPVVNVTPGNTYYIVIDGDISLPCVSGSVNNPYSGGNVFANAGYQSFPNFDYTFRTYSCGGGGGGGGCAVGVYTDRPTFDAEAGTLVFEDFGGGPGPGVIQGCDEVISSAGGSCFAAGEIQPGVEITISGPPNTTVYVGTGAFGNPDPIVGSNTFVDFTILNFPNNDVNSFGFDLYSLLGGSNVEVRIFGAGGLIDTQNVDVTSTGPVFFGYIAGETVVSVELEDLTGADVELIGLLEFGECISGGACTSVTYDATGLPLDIDPGGTSTADCVGAPNLYPVDVTGVGTIGGDSNIDNVTINITHTFDGDLDISLVSPAGTELLLSGGNGGAGDNYTDTVFMDGGGPLSGGAPPYTGTFEADGGTFAAAFDTEAITGIWNLKVCDNFGGDTGTVDTFSITICSPPIPDNDLCVDAFPIACGDVVVSETTTNTDTGGNPAPDEWYSFTGSGSPQVVTLSLCDGGTDYDAYLRVFDACGGNQIAFNDDFCGLQSELSFLSDGTSTYYIMVEGFASNSGNFSLEVTCVDPPVNDECTGALAMNCGDTVVGETITATFDAGAPICTTNISAPGVWYVFTDTTGLVTDYTLSLCDGGTDYDSKLTVYTGDCGALVCVTDNDDTCGLNAEVQWQGDGLTTYYILVHGFGSSTGNFSLALSCAPVPPPNDMIVNSIDVDEIGFPYTDPAVAMPAATTENGNPAGCNLDGANGVWYNFVPEGDGFATAEIITPGGASAVTFYTAPDENATETDLTLVDFNGNQCVPGTSAIIPTAAGQAYYVFVLNNGAITDIVIDGNNLGADDNTIAGFTYYPNPTDGVLNLNSIENIDNVVIYNILGQQVLSQTIEATSAELNVSNLTVGAYIMKVSVNGEIGTYKVIKR
jgi:subtilisin-like proprotein convertase family protein